MGIVGIALEKFNASDGIICVVSLQNVATHCIGYKKGDIPTVSLYHAGGEI